MIERDTTGVPGSPGIAATIFEKMSGSEVFVCDIAILDNSDGGRKTPNPNVLIELGYAFHALDPSNIIMVMHSAYGVPENLPFDLRLKRVISYKNRKSETTSHAVAVSVDIARCGPAHHRPEDVLRDADAALYCAKAAKRGHSDGEES